MKKHYFTNKVLSILVVSFILLTIFSCSENSNKSNYTQEDLNEQLVMATLWMQNSAEYRALCYQTFNLAKINLDNALSSNKSKKTFTIIVDCDETVIDNSAYEAFLLGKDFGYSSDTWNKWMDAAEAKACPRRIRIS